MTGWDGWKVIFLNCNKYKRQSHIPAIAFYLIDELMNLFINSFDSLDSTVFIVFKLTYLEASEPCPSA